MSLFQRINPKYQMIISYILFLFVILVFTTLTGCSDGWSIMGWEVHCPEIENKEVGE